MQPGRNDPCPCGSGKKYKKCCGAARPAATTKTPVLRQQARSAFDRGDLENAVSLSQCVLRTAPADREARHVLGLSYLRLGRALEAAVQLEEVARLDPGNPHVQSNLALCYQHLGRLDEAEYRARAALALDATLADAHNNLGQILGAKGQPEAAAASIRQATERAPGSALFHFNLGVALQSAGHDAREIAQCYRRALGIEPNFAPALSNLATLSLQQKRWDEALQLLARARAHAPDDPQILTNLGIALERLKRRDDAMDCYRRAIEIAGYVPAYSNLAIALEGAGRRDEAVDLYRQALAKDAGLQQVRVNLYRALIQQSRFEEAYDLFISSPVRGALTPSEWCAVIQVVQQMCDHRQIAGFWPVLRRAMADRALRNDDLTVLLLPLSYDDTLSDAEVLAFHRAWGAMAAADAEPVELPALGTARGGRLRIGYLSPDFRRHPVGFFIRNVIARHDRDRVEVFCYSHLQGGDDFTDAIGRSCDHFIPTVGLDDEELARRIADDGIDVLIDLAGHTANSRIEVLARRPAPVQILYLGYPNTSGAAFVDYWLTDPHAHAPDDEFHTERLLRLPECFLCFGSFEDRPRSAAPPAARKGYVTFGSFNNLAKVSPTAVRMWARILHRLPDSRLLLKTKSLGNAVACANVEAAFREHGVDRERLDLRGPTEDRDGHFDLYDSEVDIALDPLPYGGTTTTCEALWMGVPVLTLVGHTHRQRVSYSILKNIGIEATIAGDEDQYVAIAARLAADLNELQRLRARVAAALRASVLCDPVRFTRQFEDTVASVAKRPAFGSRA